MLDRRERIVLDGYFGLWRSQCPTAAVTNQVQCRLVEIATWIGMLLDMVPPFPNTNERLLGQVLRYPAIRDDEDQCGE
jgi:hypothetical protein